jgi:ABC-type phosphate transport system substrate-binding protein
VAMRRRTWLTAAALAGLLLSSRPTPVAGETAPAYRVIVNPQNPSGPVERRFLIEAFLKKTTHWGHGEAIRPVDLATDSPVRRRFSEEGLNRSVAAVKSYWQQLIFAGRDVPPPELDSDEAVVRFVLRFPGAIGYVSGGASLGGARVLAVR